MSILNDTLKSLDKRNETEDFGLSPTVNVSRRPQWPFLLFIFTVLALIVWLALGFVLNETPKSVQEDAESKSQVAAENTSSIQTPANESAASGSDVDRQKNDGEQAKLDDAEPQKLEGMQSTPLPERDIALLNTPTDVAALVLNSVDESLIDDEAPYKTRSDISAAITDEDTDVGSQNAVARAEDALNQEEAMLPLTKPESKKPSLPEATSAVPDRPVVEVAAKSPAQQSEVHFEAGLKAYNFGMFEEAQKSFTLALSTYPQNEEARKQLAALYFGQNNSLQALQVLSEGIVISPNNLMWRELMAKILVQESRFEEVLSLMPDSLDSKALAEARADYLILKGTSAQTISKPQQAVSAFSAMTSLQPNNAKWWLALGVNYDSLADTRLAISSYSRALAIGGLSSTSAQYANSRLTVLKEQP